MKTFEQIVARSDLDDLGEDPSQMEKSCRPITVAQLRHMDPVTHPPYSHMIHTDVKESTYLSSSSLICWSGAQHRSHLRLFCPHLWACEQSDGAIASHGSDWTSLWSLSMSCLSAPHHPANLLLLLFLFSFSLSSVSLVISQRPIEGDVSLHLASVTPPGFLSTDVQLQESSISKSTFCYYFNSLHLLNLCDTFLGERWLFKSIFTCFYMLLSYSIWDKIHPVTPPVWNNNTGLNKESDLFLQKLKGVWKCDL